MGTFVSTSIVFRMQGDLNARFSEGDPITEMVALQQEFDLFADVHDLKSASALLGLAPLYEPQRQGWFDFVENLKTLPSNSGNSSQNGHDLIRQTLRENLEGAAHPMFFQYHDGASDPRVLVTGPSSLVLSSRSYLTVSVPVQSAGAALRAAGTARKAARARVAQAPKAPSKSSGTAGKKPAQRAR